MITHRRAAVNGIELHVAEAGTEHRGSGPPVILCHGFPEMWFSWRHQLPALAAAGYHVLAPDQRGYGESAAPTDVDAFGIRHLTADLLGLLDDVGAEQGIFVGHDWGALIVWDLCQLHPGRVAAACTMSVPFFKPPVPPTQLFEQLSGGGFFYILYFQEVGPAEAELERDVRRTLRSVLWGASGDAVREGKRPIARSLPRAGTGFLDTMADPPAQLPGWLTEADLDVFVEGFERSGFFGPVSYYRNMDANWALVHEIDVAVMEMPTFFIAGEDDPVIGLGRAGIGLMESVLPNHRGSVLIPGAGHWNQQERPAETTEALLGFLRTL